MTNEPRQTPESVPLVLTQCLMQLAMFGAMDGLQDIGGMGGLSGNRYTIEDIRSRVERQITAIATQSLEYGQRVGVALASGLKDNNWRMRALAALLCMCDGVPRSTYAQGIVDCFVRDSRDEVRVAAALAMATLAGVPDQIMQPSVQAVMGFVREVRAHFPDLAGFVSSRTRGQPEEVVNLRTAYSGMFLVIATGQ